MPEEYEEELLGHFVNTFTYNHNPSRDFGSNREFYNDLKVALEQDEAYTVKPSLSRLLAMIQVLMNSWEKDAYTQGPVAPTTDNAMRPRADAPRNPNNLKATVGKQYEGCDRPNHESDKCRQRDIPGWNDQGRWVDSKAYKTMDVHNTALVQGDKHPVLMHVQVMAQLMVQAMDL